MSIGSLERLPPRGPKEDPGRDGKLSTIVNAPGHFDDKMIVVDASVRGERGNARTPARR